MPQYHFSRWPPALTRDNTPASDDVEAATYTEACEKFARRHQLRITEIGDRQHGDACWFETASGDDVSYSVREV